MARDTSFGEVRKFEDFLVTAIADLAEIDILSNDGGTAEVVADANDGRLRITLDGDNGDDVAAVTFGDPNWTAGQSSLKMEARIFIDDVTDYKLFIGFGDTIASGDETSFSATSDNVTMGAMSDAIGVAYDGDSTTAQLWAVAGAGDSVTVDKGLGTDTVPEAATPMTIGCWLSTDRKSAVFYVNGKEMYTINNSSVLVDASALVPGVWAYDQGTATNIDVDYIYASKGRSST